MSTMADADNEASSAVERPLNFSDRFRGDINKDVEDHECVLPLYEHAIIRYIHSGIFVELRRSIKKWLMVSDEDHESKALFKSTCQIRQEEEVHLQKHYFMIHPFSRARFYWEIAMIFVYLLQLLLIPIEISTVHAPRGILQANVTLDVLAAVDIVLFFFTGYHDREAQTVVMFPKRVALNYLKTYFFLDLMSILPASLILHLTDTVETLWMLKLLMIFRLVRIPKMIKYMKKLCQRLNIWSYNLSLLNFIICFMIFMLWTTSVVNLLIEGHFSAIANEPYGTRMLKSCYVVTMRFMLVGLGNTSDDNFGRVVNAICLFIGSVIKMVILAQIMQIYNKRSSAKNKYNSMMQQISQYMKYKELPYRLREKVFRFVNFKFQKHVYKEEDILSTLSSILKDEILLHNCKNLVEKVDFFKKAPRALILGLVAKMRSEIHLPNDVIVQAGITGNAMYFIYMGTVAVYSRQGKEICHLHDGSHFGEIALVINEPRVASVIATKDCELFRLSRKDYQEAISPFPEFANHIRRSALGRFATTIKMMEYLNSSSGDANTEPDDEFN